jgi:hypothetical protein
LQRGSGVEQAGRALGHDQAVELLLRRVPRGGRRPSAEEDEQVEVPAVDARREPFRGDVARLALQRDTRVGVVEGERQRASRELRVDT